jgi:D-alanyl-D-alanine carboxypeptidase
MPKSFHLFVSVAFLATAAGAVQAKPPAPVAAGVAGAIDAAARAAVASGETPGLQVAVFKDGKPLLVRGYGSVNLELKVPTGNDNAFRVGSVTKQFTAAALMKLQEEGKLSVDDKLSKYFPNFPRAADISLAQMLHHTSGIHNYTEDATFANGEASLSKTGEEWVAHFAHMAKTQDFEPGTQWHYSNTGYFLLGAIVEKVEGRPLAKVLHDRFFGPLGMTHTALDDERDIVIGRATGYDGAPGKFTNARFISMTVPAGAGSIRSTASDLVHWTQALQGGKVLKPESLRAMDTPGLLEGANVDPAKRDTGYGYGLTFKTVGGHKRIAHGGGIFGFSSFLADYPDDHIQYAVIANTIGKDMGTGKIAPKIERILLGIKSEK